MQGPERPERPAAPSRERPWLFFALTFGWSWFFWGLAAATGQPWTTLPTAALYVAGGIGPSLVAVLLVARGRSSESGSSFRQRLLDVRRIPPLWYAAIVAVAFGPSAVATLVPSGLPPGATSSEAAGSLLPILLVAVGAGLAEELGWRGYALDGLLLRRGPLAASLLVGAAWTLWHLPFYFITGTVQQQAGLGSPDFWYDMSARIPLAVVFTWVYLGTGRSILSAVLLHALDNVASVLVDPVGAQRTARLGILTALAVAIALFWRSAGRR